jgi:predicted dinucleotide-binding enzyme
VTRRSFGGCAQAAKELRIEATRSYAAAAEAAEVIIPAVPWRALPALIPALGDLEGKIVVDLTYANADESYLTVLDFAGRSAAEVLQDSIPGAPVVKAWNHVWAEVVADPSCVGAPVTVLTAGDPAPLYAGALSAAPYLEQYAAFLVYLGYDRNLGRRFALNVVGSTMPPATH